MIHFDTSLEGATSGESGTSEPQGMVCVQVEVPQAAWGNSGMFGLVAMDTGGW